MPIFAYKARNTGSELVEGVLEGASSGAVVDVLRGLGLTPVEIKETRAKAAKTAASMNVTLFKQKVSQIDLLLFSRQMHTLLKSGVPIMRALNGLQAARYLDITEANKTQRRFLFGWIKERVAM